MTAPVSQVGEYEGYSQARFDGWVRSSCYVTVRDGTRLAVDVYRPSCGGVVFDGPLPVAWTAKRYLRATVVTGDPAVDELDPIWGPAKSSDGGIVSANMDVAVYATVSRRLSAHGYVVAAADMRGAGASFGVRSECSDPHDGLDGHDVTEWLAEQAWCDGNVGMFGISYEGRMQLDIAATAPPHLKAIVPEVSPFDWFHIAWEGGISRFSQAYRGFTATDQDPNIAPVDEDTDGSAVEDARRRHAAGNDYTTMSGALPYRDSALNGEQPWIERSGGELVPGIAQSGIASYHRTGWYANVRLEQLLWFSNLARAENGERHRIMIGPWGAGAVSPDSLHLWAIETHRFLDYWVKGIDNGIMTEPPVVYSVLTASAQREIDQWHSAGVWPLPTDPIELCLQAGPSGSIESSNDGQLLSAMVAPGRDRYLVDYTLASPQGDGSPRPQQLGADFTEFEKGCLTYTSAPLVADVQITGHPMAYLHVSASTEDCDFFLHLEDVDEAGISTLVTRHMLRASYRAKSRPPYYYCDIGWQRSYEQDLVPIPTGEIVEVVIDLLPTAYRFRVGHRIRLAISGADAAEGLPHIVDPAPTITLWYDDRHRSRLVLPTVPVGRVTPEPDTHPDLQLRPLGTSR